jgi:hypothetical protein
MKYHNQYVHITIIGSEKNHIREPTSTIIGSVSPGSHGEKGEPTIQRAGRLHPLPDPAVALLRRNWTEFSTREPNSVGIVLNSTA